jgi:hypothetical protein
MPGHEYYEKFVASGLTSLNNSPEKKPKKHKNKEEKKHKDQDSKISSHKSTLANSSLEYNKS